MGLSDGLCLTQLLTSMGNVHDVFMGAGVKVGFSRSAVDGKKILKNKMLLSTSLLITSLAACDRFSEHVC